MKSFVKSRRCIVIAGLFLTLAAMLQGCGGSNPPISNVTSTPTPTPAPPDEYFLPKFGDFVMENKPIYDDLESKECQCRYFISSYKKGGLTASYRVGVFDSAEKAKQIFDAKVPLTYVSEVLKQTGNEIAAIRKDNGNAEVLRLNDRYIIKIEGKKAGVVALENSLPYKSFGMTQPPVRKVEEFIETPVLVSTVQKDFEKNPADATKKYVGNFVLLKTKIVEAGDNIETETIVEKTPTPRPKSSRTPKSGTLRSRRELLDSVLGKTPTPTPTPKTRKIEYHNPYVVVEIRPDGGGEPLRIVCNFNLSQKDNVIKLRNGTEIMFRAKVSFSGNLLKIEDARLDENFQ